MALRTYSVVVQPTTWDGPIEDLARLLAPIAGTSTRNVLALLRKGPMTVESDMTEASARGLEQKLRALSISPIVRGDDGSTLDDPDAGISAMLDSMGVEDIEVEDFEAMPPSRRLGTEPGLPAVNAVATAPTEEIDVAAIRPSEPVHQGRTLLGTGGMGAPLPAAVAAALSPKPPGKTAAQPPRNTDISTEDPFAVQLGPSALDWDPPQAAPAPVPAAQEPVSSGGWDALFPGITASAEAAAEGEEAATNRLPAAALATPDEVPTVVDNAATMIDTDVPEAVMALQSTLEPNTIQRPRRETPPKIKAPTTPDVSDFEAAKISRALLSQEPDKGPYQPQGFDDRLPHNPNLAAVLSALAPGAGQIYNGDDGDEAMAYGLKFILVKPWIESVRDARTQAERIASYHAKRPPEAATFRAVRYMALWWFCVVVAIAILVTMSSFVMDLAGREEAPAFTDVDVRRCHEDAVMQVQESRIAALDAVAAARTNPKRKFTMTDDERAERMFLVGYEYCRNRSYVDCEEAMKKVNAVKQGHKQALRLQSWASISRRQRKQIPMPDVGVVQTLGDYEINGNTPENDTPDAGNADQGTP